MSVGGFCGDMSFLSLSDNTRKNLQCSFCAFVAGIWIPPRNLVLVVVVVAVELTRETISFVCIRDFNDVSFSRLLVLQRRIVRCRNASQQEKQTRYVDTAPLSTKHLFPVSLTKTKKKGREWKDDLIERIRHAISR